MIRDEICTYEVAKLAKEKGFPQHIGNDAYIEENEYDDEYEVECCYPIQFIPDYLPIITAPTQSLLQRWLREEKRIHMAVFPNITNTFKFYYIVYNKGDKFWKPIYIIHSDFTTYELALEDALKYTLENLVICERH